MDPELWGCIIFGSWVRKAWIILGQNHANIVHLAQKSIFWEVTLNWFLSTFWALSCCKVWKKNFQADLDIKTCTMFGHTQAKIANLAQKRIFWEILLEWFFYLLCPIILQSLKKVLRANPVIQAHIILWHNQAKIAYLALKRIILEVLLMWYFIYLLCPILQSLKFWATITENCSFGPKRIFWKFDLSDF